MKTRLNIVNRGVLKPNKHQRRKQKSPDLFWKVYDRAQSFVLRSYTMHELRDQTFLMVTTTVSSKQLLCFVHGQGQKKRKKKYNKELCRVS